MKLKLIERTTGRGYVTFPKVSVTSKGTFYVNSKAMELLNPKDDDKVSIFQDEENKQKWYIHLSKDGYIKLRPKDPNKDASAQLSMADIAKKVVDSFYHVGTKSLKFKLLDPIQFEDRFFYPLEVIKDSINMEIPDPNGKA